MDELKKMTSGVEHEYILCPVHGKVKVFKTEIYGKMVGGHCGQCVSNEDNEPIRKADVNLPKRFIDCSFENYSLSGENSDQKLAFSICRKYAKEFKGRLKVGGCLTLYGSCGTGKTHLASAIINLIASSGYNSNYSKVYDIVQSIKNTWSDRSQTEAQAMQNYLNSDLLVIDEVGMQFGSESEELILFRILNKRYEDMKCTIVISNLDEGGLNKFLGERIIDRLKESGGANIGFKWESHRILK